MNLECVHEFVYFWELNVKICQKCASRKPIISDFLGK